MTITGGHCQTFNGGRDIPLFSAHGIWAWLFWRVARRWSGERCTGWLHEDEP